MPKFNQKQAYGIATVLVVGSIAGIALMGNKKPHKNPFDVTTPRFDRLNSRLDELN